MTPEQRLLSRQLAALPGFNWDDGMLTHTTRTAGLPGCPAGTPIRVQGGIGDLVVEGYFGAIMPDVGLRHPNYVAIRERHDASLAAARANALPDLGDDATGGVLLGWLAAMSERPTVFFDGDRWTLDGQPGATLAEACARALVALGRCAAPPSDLPPDPLPLEHTVADRLPPTPLPSRQAPVRLTHLRWCLTVPDGEEGGTKEHTFFRTSDLCAYLKTRAAEPPAISLEVEGPEDVSAVVAFFGTNVHCTAKWTGPVLEQMLTLLGR